MKKLKSSKVSLKLNILDFFENLQFLEKRFSILCWVLALSFRIYYNPLRKSATYQNQQMSLSLSCSLFLEENIVPAQTAYIYFNALSTLHKHDMRICKKKEAFSSQKIIFLLFSKLSEIIFHD